jgi:uncharacterized membrane-anchored protein
MQTRNLPIIDTGYWVAIVAASMCGANSGDLAAGPLGLGHVYGLLPMAIVFLAIIWAEKTFDWTTVAFYWLAIIVLRTMATNLADFATHDLKMSYPVFEVALVILMSVLIWLDKVNGRQASGIVDKDGVWRNLPATNWNYWITMLAAGTLGTALGDWIAERDQLNMGVYWGSLLCIPLFLGALWLATTVGKLTKPWYWLVIVACRTLGTDLGDMLVTVFRTLTGNRASALWISTACTAFLLASIIYFWRHKKAEQLRPV